MKEGITPAVVLSHGAGGLGTARSLARRGISVTAIAFEASDPILHSRFPARKFAIFGDDDEAKELRLLEILKGLPDDGAALMATSDRLVSLISNRREELLRKFRFQLPSKETLDALNDKSKEIELIKSVGFAVPKTITALPADPADLAQHLRFPIILKPHSYSVQELFPKKNEVIRNLEALREFYQQWTSALPALLAQEVITGPDSYSWICSCTFDQEFRLLDCGVKQKIRAMPAHFGGSTYAVCRNNSEIVELARELGERLEYVGHAGIEFRWDDRDQHYKYIELNPRIPANVGFDEACGLPTAWNSYKVSLGDSAVCSGIEQDEGIYFVDLPGDLSSLLVDKTPPVKIATTSLALLFKRTSGLYFAWDDPKPGLVVGYRFVVRWCRKSYKKIRLKYSASRDTIAEH